MSIERRDFLKTAIVGATQAAHLPAAPPAATSESLVSTLHKSLSAGQRTRICFPFDDPLRSKVDANWQITPHRIGEIFTPDQQQIVKEIFVGLHNPQLAGEVMRHVKEDAGGLDHYAVALFGDPGKMEFVITGRHCTARCDGDAVPGMAFGGPVFYGHQSGAHDLEAAGHGQNVYWFQGKRANEVFASMSGKQRELALLKKHPRVEKQNKTVELKTEAFDGLPVADMTRDQRELVEKVLSDLLLPFRQKDAGEARRLIQSAGGIESLHMAYYKNFDVGGDGVWDVWQLEGPKMVWFFRGYPHVHVWVRVEA